MLLCPHVPLLGPSRRSLICEGICIPENSWFEEYGWSKPMKWGRYSNLLQETLQWLLASWYLISLGAVCSDSQSDNHTAAEGRCLVSFTATCPHCRLQCSLHLVSLYSWLCALLNLQMQSVSLVKRRACFHCRYIRMCNFFRLAHSNCHFVQISLKHSFSKGIILKKQNTKCWIAWMFWSGCQKKSTLSLRKL